MSNVMTESEMRAAMRRAGVGEAAIDIHVSRLRLKGRTEIHTDDSTPIARRSVALPLRFTLPWSALISENRRFCAKRNSIFMTAPYKDARAKTKKIVRELIGDAAPLACPLALTARVYFPDNRVHDAPNFAGATHNALKGVVFEDDRWLYRATWERAGVDVDSPRAEIEITRVCVKACGKPCLDRSVISLDKS